MIPDIWQLIFNAVGGGTVALAVCAFFGRKWVEHRFNTLVNNHRHAQEKEIQRLRIEIESLLSGALMIQQKEFEILPKVWDSFNNTYRHIRGFTVPFMQVANLDTLGSQALEEFLAGTKLTASQKEQVMASDHKISTYEDMAFWYKLRDMRVLYTEFYGHLSEGSIFFPHPIKEQLFKAAGIMHKILNKMDVGKQRPAPEINFSAWKNVEEELDPIHKLIGELIHYQLRSHSAVRPTT